MLTSWLQKEPKGRKNLLNLLVEKKVIWCIREIVIPVEKNSTKFC